jgi:prepilin-type N-terminal cleavage/methylation domain-containing protein
MNAGVSLIELLVVLAVMAILMSLILVAIQRSREAARRAMCQNNMRQIHLASRRYFELRKHGPNEAPDGQIGGWPIELMPFLEETELADQLLSSPSLDPANISPLVRRRPTIFTCPSGYEGDSEIAEVPTAHYVMWVSGTRKSRRGGRVGGSLSHAPVDCRIPWPAGPEYDADDTARYELLRDFDPHVSQ